MKKISKNLILILICILLISACGIGQSQIGYPMVGTLVNINNEETVTVVEASIVDGKITVVLDVKFEKIRILKDFERIIVCKSEVGSKDIVCNINETTSINTENVFNAPYTGKITLVFSDESISDEHDLANYRMFLEYTTENGIDGSKGFCLK